MVGLSELERLKLELYTPADFNTLAVFIKDPLNPKQYWHRAIEIKPGIDSSSGKIGPEYTDVQTLEMEEFDIIPCPEQHLKIAVRIMTSYREKDKNNPHDKAMKAAVGVAVYEGEKKLSLEEIVNIVGAKYGTMRREYLATQN